MDATGAFTRAAVAAAALLVCLPGESVRGQRTPFSVCFQSVGCFSRNGTFAEIVGELPRAPEQVRTEFRLFTRRNREGGQPLDYLDEDSVNTDLFSSRKPFYVLVHGHGDVGPAWTENPLKSALLDQSDCQVVIVNWSGGSSSIYWQAAVNSELVGRQVGALVHLLKTRRSLDPSLVHPIGFSLGAQVAGFAGKWTRDQYGYLLGRITALDPASLMFENHGPKVHVWRDDAEFVDVVHTSGNDLSLGEMGTVEALGHVDFYPNGGKQQAGCPQGDSHCNHMQAETLFLESVRQAGRCFFASAPCPAGYEAFRRGDCAGCGDAGCGRMGMPSRHAPGRGVQYLDTNDRSPFCKTA